MKIFLFAALSLAVAFTPRAASAQIDLRKNGSPQHSQAGPSAAPAGAELSFRGLKSGMSKQEIETALGGPLICENLGGSAANTPVGPQHPGWACLFGLSEPLQLHLEILLNGFAKLWSVRYRFQPDDVESVQSFVSAFTAKYGMPLSKNKAYRNSSGATVTGEEFSWRRAKQELSVQELCGKLDESCVQLIDAAYGPKSPAPQI